MGRGRMAAAGATVVLAAGVAALVIPGSSAPVRSTAAQFTPASSWQQTGDLVEPPRLVCLGSMPCPSLVRTWDAPAPVSVGDLVSAASAWRVTAPAGCDVDPGKFGRQTVCELTGTADGFDVSVRVTAQAPDASSWVVTLTLS